MAATATEAEITVKINQYIASGAGENIKYYFVNELYHDLNNAKLHKTDAAQLYLARYANAISASKLRNARSINGVAFDGTNDIIINRLYKPNGSESNIFVDENGVLNVNGVIIKNGDLNFIYTQNTPSNEWIITHNLAKYPSVTITDTAGNEMQGEVHHIDINNLKINFSAGFAGKATLN